MEEQDRYGTKQLVQGKKEALTERVEQIRKEEEPERENAKIAKMIASMFSVSGVVELLFTSPLF